MGRGRRRRGRNRSDWFLGILVGACMDHERRAMFVGHKIILCRIIS